MITFLFIVKNDNNKEEYITVTMEELKEEIGSTEEEILQGLEQLSNAGLLKKVKQYTYEVTPEFLAFYISTTWQNQTEM